MKITYSTKDLDAVDDSMFIKPAILESELGMPLEKLDPKTFELLTYFTITQCIRYEKHWNGFEDIQLLGGVKDHGMDCVFIKDGNNTGLIQCKHSSISTPFGKTMAAKEILKFLLYSINKPSLIPDMDNFTYYLFASAGLNPDTKILLEDFNAKITTEPSLKKWVNDVIAQHASLKNLIDYNRVKEKLYPLLEKIKLRNLPREDIELLLSQSYNINLLKKFFSVRSVIDIAGMSDLLDKKLRPTLSYEEAHTLALSASSDLNDVHAHFGTQSSTHLDRPETQQIFNWVLSDLQPKQKGLAVLEANAGLGKTVIFRDVCQLLLKNDIPVLAIKADRYYAENRVSLEEKLFQKKDVAIKDVVSALKENHHKIVVLIDQLDALSQTLSTHRDFLLTYNRLISDLVRMRGVRVLISVRTFDLNYDADLSTYKSAVYKNFVLGPLPKDSVRKILAEYDIKSPSDTFLDLLGTPNHLNTFCKLSATASDHTDQLKSLNDLHNALWNDLMVMANKRSLQLKTLLYRVAQTMYERERITVPNLFRDEFNNELDFLGSKDILLEDTSGLHFFHQTFYDFIFAKQFVERGASLMSYLQQHGQSLYVRPVVKMVVEYLRLYNPKLYIHTLKQIVSKSKYRFHIKLLMINSLGLVDTPSDMEKKFVYKVILRKLNYLDAFLCAVRSRGWMMFLMERRILHDNLFPKPTLQHRLRKIACSLVKKTTFLGIYKIIGFDQEQGLRRNLVLRVLQNNRLESLDLVIDYLNQQSNYEDSTNLVQNVLIQIDHWENKNLLSLFDQYFPYRDENQKRQDNFWFYQILGKIAEHHLAYCITKLTPIVLTLFAEKSLNLNLGHDLDKIIKQLNGSYPKETFIFLFELMKIIIENQKEDIRTKTIDTPLYKAWYFSDIQLVSSVADNADEVLFGLLKEHLEKLAATDPENALQFYEKNKNSNAIPILKLCALLLAANPSYFHSQTFAFITLLHSKNGFNDWDNQFQFLLRKLLGATFPHFLNEQQKETIAILFSIKHPHELSVFTDNEKKNHIVNSIGKKQYLFIHAIPQNHLRKHPKLWRRYQELKRKFNEMPDRPMDQSRMISYGVGGPLQSSAYTSMNLENWKKSMRKYGDDYVRKRTEDPTRGGKSQHAQAFKVQVEKKPAHFYPLVQELFASSVYSQDYLVYGLWGLIEGKFNPPKIYQLYKNLIKEGVSQEHIMLSIWFNQYFIQHQLIDKDALDYLSDLVFSHPDRKGILNPENLQIESLNSVRSAALIKIMQTTHTSEFSIFIFDIVEEALKDNYPSIQAAILGNVAHLKHFDMERAFSIFNTAINTENPELLKCSFVSASYFLHSFFERMKPYLTRTLAFEELHKDSVVLITKSWIFELGAEDSTVVLLNKAFESGENAICAILDTAEDYLFDNGELNAKCNQLLFRCLSYKGDEIASRFSGLILRKFKPENFYSIYPFLQSYVETMHPEKEPRYFIQYIISSARVFPIECLELMKKSLHLGHGDVQKRGFLDKEPVQAALAIYSALNMDPKRHREALEQTLDMFDQLLLNNRIRGHASAAIALL
ncbi:hypothetical protein C21_00169 [Arenibacter sp. NBRC 103722]|uniref:ATP-binding protein n=1 Tax=Arenibacter sp. NBRC 103722 TaxID=1113929 RepID=UPI000853DC16|nr:ATP-binding protein [Arenibacter sp. NBRC 103722]GBF18013.1 hypothetical protein C21_00169 [Arenibacter sp. NBRC 103722]